MDVFFGSMLIWSQGISITKAAGTAYKSSDNLKIAELSEIVPV
jgi:hypothetical protein